MNFKMKASTVVLGISLLLSAVNSLQLMVIKKKIELKHSFQQDTRVAVVSNFKIMQHYVLRSQKKDLALFSKDKKLLEKKHQVFKTAHAAFVKKQDKMNEKERQSALTQLESLQQEFYALSSDLKEKQQKKQAEYIQSIEKKLHEAIQKICKAKNISVVLLEPTVIASPDVLDITKDCFDIIG